MKITRQKTRNKCWKECEEYKSSYTDETIMKINMEVTKKIKSRNFILSSYFTTKACIPLQKTSQKLI